MWFIYTLVGAIVLFMGGVLTLATIELVGVIRRNRRETLYVCGFLLASYLVGRLLTS